MRLVAIALQMLLLLSPLLLRVLPMLLPMLLAGLAILGAGVELPPRQLLLPQPRPPLLSPRPRPLPRPRFRQRGGRPLGNGCSPGGGRGTNSRRLMDLRSSVLLFVLSPSSLSKESLRSDSEYLSNS